MRLSLVFTLTVCARLAHITVQREMEWCRQCCHLHLVVILQQSAARSVGVSVDQTGATLADQQLAGLTVLVRTDSLSLLCSSVKRLFNLFQ